MVELPRPGTHLTFMRANVNHTELYFDVEGGGLAVDGDRLHPRPTLVALHGGPGFDHGYLRPGLGPLAADAQVVYVDLRGQGRSAAAPLESISLEQMADDVAELCRVLGIERPVVLGHSAGGFVALHLALRHPELPAGLILCHTAPALTPHGDSPPGPAERGGPDAAAVAARLFAGDLSAEVQEGFGRLVLPLYAGPGNEDVPRRVMGLTRLDADVAGHFFARQAARYDVRPGLPSIGCPTLVIVGRHDWVCPPAAGKAIAGGIPGARLVELDSGHFGFAETPEPFLRACREELARAG